MPARCLNFLRTADSALSVMMLQIVVQRRRTGFLQERLEHHVFAAALRETWSIFFSQGGHFGIPVLAFNFSAFVAMAAIKTRF
jgi:hypothetical protein